MASLDPRELATSDVTFPKVKRMAPDGSPGSVLRKRFAVDGSAREMSAGYPVAFNTSTGLWTPWASAGSNNTNKIRGFIYPDSLTLSDTLEEVGQVLTRGIIHRDDVVLPSGEIQADLDTALKANLREIGLTIEGLDGIP